MTCRARKQFIIAAASRHFLSLPAASHLQRLQSNRQRLQRRPSSRAGSLPVRLLLPGLSHQRLAQTQQPRRRAVILDRCARNAAAGRRGRLAVTSVSVSPAEGRVLRRVHGAAAAAIWLPEEELHLGQRGLVHQEVPVEGQHRHADVDVWRVGEETARMLASFNERRSTLNF